MNSAIARIIPILFILIFVTVVRTAAHKSVNRRVTSSTSASRPAPLRTNVPKGQSGENVYAFDRDGQPVRASAPSRQSGNYKTVASYAPNASNKDSTRSAASRVYSSRPMRAGSMHFDTVYSMEDRQNDWLAKQLREESRLLKRTSDMFDLKMEHLDDCDARDLKETHARNHRLGRID